MWTHKQAPILLYVDPPLILLLLLVAATVSFSSFLEPRGLSERASLPSQGRGKVSLFCCCCLVNCFRKASCIFYWSK